GEPAADRHGIFLLRDLPPLSGGGKQAIEIVWEKRRPLSRHAAVGRAAAGFGERPASAGWCAFERSENSQAGSRCCALKRRRLTSRLTPAVRLPGTPNRWCDPGKPGDDA